MEHIRNSDKYYRMGVWLLVSAFCIFFWAGTYSLFAAGYSHGLRMPPAKYDYVPKVRPLVVYTKQATTNRLCRAKGSNANFFRRSSIVVGCAMKIVGGTKKGRHLVYVATDAAVSPRQILRHEYGHVNGWRH